MNRFFQFSDIQKLNVCYAKRVEESSGKSDFKTDKKTESEAKNIRKLAKFSKSSSTKDATKANKFKKVRTKANKKIEKKPGKIAEFPQKLAETRDKNEARRTTMGKKNVNESSKDSKKTSESEKNEKERKMKKVNRKKDEEFEFEKASVESAKSSRKIKLKNPALKRKSRSVSEKESKSVEELEKPEINEKSKTKKRKRRNLSKDLHESEKVKDRKKAKKHRSTSKSTSEQYKVKKRKVKKAEDQQIYQKDKNSISKDKSKISNKKINLNREIKKLKGGRMQKSKHYNKFNFVKQVDEILTSESEKESKKTKTEGKLSFRRKTNQRRQNKLPNGTRTTNQSISTTAPSLSDSSMISATTPVADISISPTTTISSSLKKPLSDDRTQETGTKTGSVSEGKREKERIITKKPEVMPRQDDVKRNDKISRGMRKIMDVFIQKKSKTHAMTTVPKQYGIKENEETSSDIIQGSGIII